MEDGDGPANFAEAGDVALLLHTSGTTSRPKIVPLTHGNLCASAANIRGTLGLAPADRCLNIMPLFHIHGLIAAVSSSLGAGASVYCTPGFNALRFFSWLGDAAPSWYTAVPTMHQAILSRAARNAEAIAKANLRFIRSSSSSLPPQVMAELEATFGAPVIESYGMTEATHQMASNPLPPLARKPGTVGIAAGPEMAVMGEDDELAKPGAVGEIVIRGPNVTPGYEANPKANAEGFIDGWFRTGDQGVFDDEGYLTITGRLKEIINRGGEKVSPREVDDVLMDHPAVAQVVTFAMPHDKLGEEVAAAVVLRDGAAADEGDIRAFATQRLAAFKVPRTVLFLERNPQGRHRQAATYRPGREAGPRRETRSGLMRVCIYGAGAIGGYLGAELAAAGVDVTLIARGPHLAAMRANGLKLLIGGEERISHPRCTDDPAEAGPQDYVIITPQGPFGTGHRRLHGAPARPRHRGGDGGQRHSLVVFPRPRRAVARPSPRECRSRRRAVGRHRPRARHWLRRLSGLRHAGPRRHPACRGQPLQPGRAQRREERAGARARQGADRGRAQGPGAAAHPRRNLDQAMGQPVLQPDQRADPRHARRDRHRPGHPAPWRAA